MLIKKIKIILAASLLFGFGLLTSCDDDDNNPVVVESSIVDLASNTSSLTCLFTVL